MPPFPPLSLLTATESMARSLLPPHDEPIVEEDYIDMDVSLCYAIPSPPHSRDFEFQMSSKPPVIDDVTSPADELFYKGNLLPLHLPPRLELVRKLLRDSPPMHYIPFDDSIAKTNFNTAVTTPYESCNATPAASCHVSGELNAEEYFGIQQQPSAKKSWTKKLRLTKKLKASKAYLKSLFTKSGCSDEPSAVPAEARRVDGEKMVQEPCGGHRRSFSGAIKRRSSTNKSSSGSTSCSSSSSSSSFSSVNSSGAYGGPQALRRSSSANSEVECSIQGAIAYCKKSQQEACARKSVSDVEFYALSASRIAADCEKLERPEICRG